MPYPLCEVHIWKGLDFMQCQGCHTFKRYDTISSRHNAHCFSRQTGTLLVYNVIVGTC